MCTCGLPAGPELLWLQLCLLTGPVLLYVLCCSSASYILPCVPGRLVQLPVLPMRSVAAALLLPVVTFLTDALLDMAREIILPVRDTHSMSQYYISFFRHLMLVSAVVRRHNRLVDPTAASLVPHQQHVWLCLHAMLAGKAQTAHADLAGTLPAHHLLCHHD